MYVAVKPGERPVALKVPYSDLAEDDLAMFDREFSIHGQICHSRIVRMYDSSTEKSLTYAALELMPGGTLEEFLTTRRVQTEEVVTILEHVGSALNYMHEMQFRYHNEVFLGVVHRDLNPRNIFLDGRGGVKLGDLGLAKPLSMAGTTTRCIGTPPYMAPEQLRPQRDSEGRPIHLSPSCDMWQLGCLTYELMFRQLPFGPFGNDDVNVVQFLTFTIRRRHL